MRSVKLREALKEMELLATELVSVLETNDGDSDDIILARRLAKFCQEARETRQ